MSDPSFDTPLAAQLARNNADLQALNAIEFPRPNHPVVMTFANQKGGVGKTTSAVNIAAALALGGLKVVVIDIDPQGNASTALGAEHREGTPSIYEVLLDGIPLASVLQQCPEIPNLRVAPATLDLSGAEVELVDVNQREFLLQRTLADFLRHEPEVDYVIIDCPPSLGMLTLNAFVAATDVTIPIQAEYYALEGLSSLLRAIERIKNALNSSLRISNILVTMYDSRTNLSREVVQEVRNHFPQQLLSTPIPRSVRLSEAPSYSQTGVTYDPRSTGALAYRKAALQIARRFSGGN
ncbi:chromosome partitioning protein [Boudabousia tangfeifanii]|uniref:Chromosome partitioning protein n=1 Tax=Boudabousia tangfeifanii TaxID=1912795 RepID=A0A1D9MM78_9ACTO|nr:ParA family protein [Boudabousia tangfeifanii]AOZ73385.1 chromosome partitioning protein [Boudabousia tangfeifanii]